MLRFVAKRIGLSILTLFLVSVIVFIMTSIMPGDIAKQVLGRDATPEAFELWNKEKGFDKPLVVQYGRWIGGVMTGNLGTSLKYEMPVSEILGPAASKSAQLAIVALLIIAPVSILGGVVAAMNRGKKIDRALTVGGLSAAVIPEFVWAVVLILLFGVAVEAFPVYAFPEEENPNLISSVYHLILPSIALLFVLFGYISRITRAGVVEALDSDYMRTAVLKGLSIRVAVVRHVLRNALLPTIAVIATQVPYLAGGLIAIERVFNYPGFGNILLAAVIARDFPLLQTAVFLIGVVIVSFQLIADILFAVLNPRIRQRVTE
ncbi:MAG: ABC transporter permease [Actinobacteria bacterium]|nr:ABC transporter permease [Actinomycetota bacterium]